MTALLTVAQVAAILQVTPVRIYQMDAELQPVVTPRNKIAGTRTMRVRHYRPEIVEAVRERRAARAGCKSRGAKTHSDSYGAGNAVRAAQARIAAREIASRHLLSLADTTPFFVGVAPEDTDAVRAALRELAASLF